MPISSLLFIVSKEKFDVQAAHAVAVMLLQLRRPRPRQSKPSIRTAASMGPNLACAQLLCFEDIAGRPGWVSGSSSLKRASWMIGFVVRSGGDPQKKGGEEASAWFSSPACKSKSINFDTNSLYQVIFFPLLKIKQKDPHL